MDNNSPTAALLIIGNEILSGRTQDTNLNYIAKGLGSIGVRFMETRVVPDVESVIIAAVNELRKKYDYLFTTGGIGPTHDDITAEAIAKAFNVPLIEHEDAAKLLHNYYKENITEARLRMARTPQGAKLIDNPVSIAPGFIVGNVYVMAGVPKIMQSMFDAVKLSLRHGDIVYSEEISADIPESKIATDLGEIQLQFPQTDIGSYPHMREGKYAVSVVVRAIDKQELNKAVTAVKAMFKLYLSN